MIILVSRSNCGWKLNGKLMTTAEIDIHVVYRSHASCYAFSKPQMGNLRFTAFNWSTCCAVLVGVF